jgi:CubicO group peptidase (beta-lactamase class C family)
MSMSALDAALAAAAEVAGELVSSQRISGAVIAASDASGGLALAAEGRMSDGRMLATDDRFLVTSVTKLITAVQIMRLVDQGRLDLCEPVVEVIPDFVGSGKERVLVHHLLTHTSGLSLRANVVEGPPTGLDAAELEAHAVAAPLSRPPGTAVEYCSPGFWVLSSILRRRAERDHVADLARLVDEIGLTAHDLGYDVSATPSRLVEAIVSHNGHLPEQVRRVAYPAGGVLATGEGLARLGAALVASLDRPDAILSPAAIRAMTRIRATGTWPDGRPASWGLGVELDGPGDLMSGRTMFHFGASGVAFWVDLDRKVSLAVLTADWYSSKGEFARIANAFAAALSRHPELDSTPTST